MTNLNISTSPALGLDVGTSRIVVARRAAGETKYESQLNAFVSIPRSRITEGVLEREKIPHSLEDGAIIVHGNESEKFAGLLNAEMRRPMHGGVLDAREPESLKVIRELLAAVLNGSAGRNERKVTFTVPAAPLGAADALTYHEATLRQILSDMGYEPTSINEGLAVIYSELESSNYTGIGISCGGGLCNVCLAYLSVPVMSFSIPKAGDFIDSSAAQVTGERANRVRLAKEDSFHFNGFFADKMHQVISVYYDDMIQSLVGALREAFAGTPNIPRFNRPVPMVLSGGTTMPKGFRDRFEKLLLEQEFPVKVSEIRMAENPLHATAKGALACALSDS
jgi:actin-like ATPase involved in cell morphogenesis